VSETVAIEYLTKQHASRALEQALGALWVAVLEARGLDPRDGWNVVIDAMHLERAPQTTTNGAPLEGGDGVPALAPSRGAGVPG